MKRCEICFKSESLRMFDIFVFDGHMYQVNGYAGDYTSAENILWDEELLESCVDSSDLMDLDYEYED